MAWIPILLSGVVALAPIDDRAATRYTLSFPEPHTHYMEVRATYPTGGAPQLDLMMVVWTPGSYLVREYARNVEGMRASAPGGKALPVEKTRKNRWRVATDGAAEVVVEYRVYCREMSVRTNWVESDYAVLNGAASFLTRVGHLQSPHEVSIVLADGWTKSATGLPAHADGAAHHFLAPDFDTLVDCPIVCGNPCIYEFEVAGVKHYLVNQGEGGIWDGPRSAEDVKKIVEAHFAFWKVLPYESYYFLNVISESGGGLEHKSSTLMLTSRWRSRVPDSYHGWLGLVSHEFFHTWNVKRLRPVELGPFDYENEVYTRSLWIAEGVTSYYDDLLVHRAGLSKRKKYLKALSKNIDSLQTTPGRLVHPLEMASYDAWIKHYRRDENTPNSTISYYTKGAVVAFLLDAHIRRLTDGERSLDEVMRRAYQIYSGERGYSPDEFRLAAQETAGKDLGEWFRVALETTEELDYQEALDWYGLRFKDPEEDKKENGDGDNDDTDADTNDDDDDDEKDEKDEKKPPKGWLGLRTRNADGRLVVTQVRRGTPAHQAGFNVDDEILAIGDYRVRAGGWQDRLKQYRPGHKATILIARRDKLMTREVVFEKEPPKRWRLAVRKNATEEQKKRLADWLGS